MKQLLYLAGPFIIAIDCLKEIAVDTVEQSPAPDATRTGEEMGNHWEEMEDFYGALLVLVAAVLIVSFLGLLEIFHQKRLWCFSDRGDYEDLTETHSLPTVAYRRSQESQ